MYYVNKLAIFVVNPVSIAIALAAVAYFWRRRRCVFLALAAVWLWFWASALPARWIGVSLEGADGAYPQREIADYPEADAIVELGGGMWGDPEVLRYPELTEAGDRAWFAGRLYKAGKAPLVIPTGSGSSDSDALFLKDYGVPDDALVIDDEARNTEENAKFVLEKLKERGAGRRVLLVTSAWHMRRSVLMFEKYAPELEIFPAAADYTFTSGAGRGFSLWHLLPGTENLNRGVFLFKELLGYWGYLIFR